MPKHPETTLVWNSTSYGTGLTGSFSTGSGEVRAFFAGSAYSESANATLAVNLLIDGNVVLTLNGCTNEALSHKALVPAFATFKLSSGQHTATLSTSSTTVIDLNDYFTLEIGSR